MRHNLALYVSNILDIMNFSILQFLLFLLLTNVNGFQLRSVASKISQIRSKMYFSCFFPHTLSHVYFAYQTFLESLEKPLHLLSGVGVEAASTVPLLVKSLVSLPIMYALMSVNEYITHRFSISLPHPPYLSP